MVFLVFFPVIDDLENFGKFFVTSTTESNETS